jgi:release factor glutamine methyltransferase
MKIDNALKKANSILKNNYIKSSLLDCELLLSKSINQNREYIILNLDQKIKEKDYLIFTKLIEERSKGKPIAYLTGKKNFWKYEFDIEENVLIPRPDTELIIQQVLKIYKNKNSINFLDVGVGSGAILLSILKEKIGFLGTGIDISNTCLNVCKKNADKLNVNKRIKLFKSNIDNFHNGKYDLIISNPPYIKKLDLKKLDRDVRDFEPKLALNGGLDGLSEIRKIILRSTELIKKNGKLILEIAFNQKHEVKKILKNNGFYITEVIKDFAKNDRCIISKKI